MHPLTENHGDLICEIEAGERDGKYLGRLKYRYSDIGTLPGPDIGSIRTQFRAICKMVDDGGMVRNGIIMLGYHNKQFEGDVLLVDGELLGAWNSDELEWCHFTEDGSVDVTCSASSPWMLHDAIAEWVASRNAAIE